MKIYQTLLRWVYLPYLEKLTRDIGCKLTFHHIPQNYIQAVISCEMTATWKRAGLDILKGQNYFTMGKVSEGGSSRFSRTSQEFQSWLGGYTVKLRPGLQWTVEDYCRLGVADQNSWLRWYGDPTPFTTIDGWHYEKLGTLQLGHYDGILYEGGFTTHSDVGPNLDTVRFRFAAHSMAALFNLANPRLDITADVFKPLASGFPYEPIRGRVYLCIVDVKPDTKVLLYANGINIRDHGTRLDTFEGLKDEFIKTMLSCEITGI